jgi:PAS domain S-box-containing protein
MDLDALLNNLLSGGTDTADPMTARRVKGLNSLHLIFIMITPIVGLFYFYIGVIFFFYVFIIAGVFMILSLILLRKTGSITVAGNCAVFILWATTFMMTWYTGPITSQGVIKPSLIMNAGLIILALFFMGYLWGAVWTILIFIETGVIVYLFLIQYPFPNLIPAEISEIYTLGTYLFALLLLFVFAFLYEKERMDFQISAAKMIDRDGNLKGEISTIQEIRTPDHVEGSSENESQDLPGEPFTDPVLKIDPQGVICFWDKGCEEQFGYTSSQMLGRSPESLISKQYMTDFKGTILDVLKGASFKDKEWQYNTSDGKQIYVLAKAYPMRSPDKKHRECVIVNRDITALIVKQRKLEHFVAENKEKMKNLTEEYDLVKKNIASFIRKKDDVR